MIRLLLCVAGIDGVGDHGARGCFGHQLFQGGPGAQPRVYLPAIQRLGGELIKIGGDVGPVCLGERRWGIGKN